MVWKVWNLCPISTPCNVLCHNRIVLHEIALSFRTVRKLATPTPQIGRLVPYAPCHTVFCTSNIYKIEIGTLQESPRPINHYTGLLITLVATTLHNIFIPPTPSTYSQDHIYFYLPKHPPAWSPNLLACTTIYFSVTFHAFP